MKPATPRGDGSGLSRPPLRPADVKAPSFKLFDVRRRNYEVSDLYIEKTREVKLARVRTAGSNASH